LKTVWKATRESTFLGWGSLWALTRRKHGRGRRGTAPTTNGIAFAALDPISQIGWGVPSTIAVEVGAHLVRDVFVAADEMHENAMSSMDGNTEMEVVAGEDEGAAEAHDGAAEGWDSSRHLPDVAVDATENMEDDMDGENPKPVRPLQQSAIGGDRVLHSHSIVVPVNCWTCRGTE
jgi:hypothetical protein